MTYARTSSALRERMLAFVLSSLACASPQVYAQAAQPAAPEPTTKKEKDADVVTLSPFEVVTEKDKGFMAVNAGTATKLGLDLKDTPVAYSVMTREFLDTLGITNLQDSVPWATSGAVAATDGTPNDSTSTPNRVFTQQRGQLNQTAQQRNFFLNAGLGDTYSAERIDFGRGPNALFFNFGDINNPFAGGTSIQTKQARVDRAFETVTATVGSWDYYRATADVNQPVNRKLAVRTNLLFQDADGYRVGSWDNRKGVTLTGTYVVTPKTEVRVSGSYDHFERTQTYAGLFDNLSGWDGVTVVTGPITNAMLGSRAADRSPTAGTVANARGQYLSSGGDVQGVGRMGVSNVYIPGEGIMNWQNFGFTQRADANEYIPVYQNGRAFSRYDLWSSDVSKGLFTTSSSPTPAQLLNLGFNSGNGGSPLLYQTDLPSDRFDRAIMGSHFRLPDKRYTVTPRKTPFLSENDRDIYAVVTHKFTDDLFFSMAIDGNDAKVRLFNQGSANRMRYAYVDINEVLPNGAKNPHFLDVYSDDTNIAYRNYQIKNAGIRPSVNYILNLGGWGNYTFNLGGALTQRTTTDRQWIYSLATDADPRKWAGSNVIKVREYWDNPIMPTGSFGALPYFNNTFNADGTVASSSTTTVNPQFVNNGGSTKHERTMGFAFATAARYFHSEYLNADRLVITAGIGLNRLETSQQDMMIRGDLPTTWDSKTMIFKPNAPADWATLTYVPVGATTPKLAASRPRLTNVDGVAAPDPAYSQYRFRDDYNLPDRDEMVRNFSTGFVYRPFRWMDAKVNYSNSNIPPVVGVLDINGMPAKPTAGYGYDARIGLTPVGDRFVFNLGWFYNYAEFLRGTTPIATPVNNLYATRTYTNTNTNDRNEFSFTDLNGLSDYFKRINTGLEFEMVGHLAPGLEVSGSYSRYHQKDFDRNPLTPAYIEDHKADFLKVLVAAGGKLDTTTKPVAVAPGLAVADPSLNLSGAQATNQNNAVSNYNAIWTNYQRVVDHTDDGSYGAYGQTFNFFVRHEVQRGFLKALRTGLGVTWKAPVNVGNHAGDVVVNPNYDKTKAFNTNAGTIDSSGHYTYKDSAGNSTGYNAPWMPDPSINQLSPPINWSPSQTNVVLTLGYSHKLPGNWPLFSRKLITYNLIVNNLLNRQIMEYINSTTRAPGGDYFNTQNARINERAVMAGYQEPISFRLTTTVTF